MSRPAYPRDGEGWTATLGRNLEVTDWLLRLPAYNRPTDGEPYPDVGVDTLGPEFWVRQIMRVFPDATREEAAQLLKEFEAHDVCAHTCDLMHARLVSMRAGT